MSEAYQKPVINKLASGRMNKFGRSPAYARRVRDQIDGARVDDLVRRFGSPLFVYSEKALRRKVREAHRAFSTRYPNVRFAWSYKTNYLPAICAMMHQEGADAEVVSEMEYAKARVLGVPGERIVLNGPHKPVSLLERAVSEGAAINLDHLDEISDLEQIAKRAGRTLPVGLRLNLDAGIYPQWSRFGFNLESGQAFEAARRIAQGGRLAIRGLHCHVGTFILDSSAYARQVEKMAAFGYAIEEKFGFGMEYVDIGGGFPSRNLLKGTYLPPDVAVPSIDEYAEAVSAALSRGLKAGDFPRLIVESGRALVDEAGWLIATVVAVKRLPDGARAYVMDAGVNLLPTSYWYKSNIELDREVPGINEHSVIYGPLCMNIDVLDEAAMLPPLARGTRLLFSPAGAYNNTQWLQFITYRPNVALVGENGEVDVIREAEDATDFSRREKLPERLACFPKQ